MFHSASSKSARTGRSSGVSRPDAPRPDAPDTSVWIADEAERRLAEELEKVLNQKPSSRAIRLKSEPGVANEPKGAGEAVTALSLTEALAQADGTDTAEGGFEWQTQGRTAQQSDTSERHSHDTALQWVAKARSDKRRRRGRNVLGWITTLIVGGALLGGAAYGLLGWQPDLGWLWQLGQKLASK